MGILCLICGVVGIVGGILAKEFHSGNVDVPGAYGQKIPTWAGRLISIVVGVFFIAVGIKFLVSSE